MFGALFALEEVREILRQTAPGHELDEAQKKKMASALAEVKKHLSVLEELA